MLNYTFSRREKVLLVVLAAILLFMLWYLLVWQGTASQKQEIDSEIAEVQAQTLAAQNKASKMVSMQTTIDERKASGAKPATLPPFDNTTALMAQLNTVLSSTVDYRLVFDELDTTADGVVVRGVTITFGCDSIDAGRAVMTQLEEGPFACSIDAATITSTSKEDSRTGNARVGVNTTRSVDAAYAVGLHVNFYETT